MHRGVHRGEFLHHRLTLKDLLRYTAEGIISLLMGGEIVINYIAPEEVESPWDDNDYNGPQAA